MEKDTSPVLGAVYIRKPRGRTYTWVLGHPTLNEARTMIRWDRNDGTYLYFWCDGGVRMQLERPTFVGPLKGVTLQESTK